MELIVTHLFEYPLKSSRGRLVQTAEIGPFGMSNDRRFAIIDDSHKVVTAREHPKIVLITSEAKNKTLLLTGPNREQITIPYSNTGPNISARLFNTTVQGVELSSDASHWISILLGSRFKLIYMPRDFGPALKTGLQTGFVDSAPLHLISLATLDHLNLKLDHGVGVENFRPNIVMNGNLPFEEENWTGLTINNYKLQVEKPTERCIMTTIDPWTGVKDSAIEPLATLGKERKRRRSPINFGLDLRLKDHGTISVGDVVNV